MIKKHSIENIVNQCMNALPPGVSVLRHDIKKHLKTSLQSILSKLDLVTREEFDVQAAVLKRTREKLETIEARLKQQASSTNTENTDKHE